MANTTFTQRTQSNKLAPPQIYKNLLFESVLVVAAIGLVLHFLVLPKRSVIRDEQVGFAQLQTQRNNIEQNTEQLDKLVKQMKSAGSDISLLDESLPLEPRITTVHVLLESLVNASGLTLASISVDSNDAFIVAGDKSFLTNRYAGQKKLESVSVNVNATGTMSQFVNFLQTLEKSARLMDVTGLQITGNNEGLAAFRLTIKTYFYPTAQISEGALKATK